MGTFRLLFRNRALLAFMLGHFTVDMYGGILPILFPVFSDKFELSNQSVGFIALGFTAAASLSQPLFGYVADRWGSRYLAVASMVWSGVMVGLIGLSPSFAVVLALATLAGLGSGAYHPQGASNAAQAVGDTNRNTALALYTVGGTTGYALGPLIGALVLLLLGAGGTLVLMPYGIIVAVLLLGQLRKLGLGLPTISRGAGQAEGQIFWGPLLLVVGVVMVRSWVEFSTINFIPLWFDDQGYSTGFYGALQSLALIGGAAGTLTGGALADRFGQKLILVLSLIISMPLLILFAATPGPASLLVAPAFTFAADMGLAITLVMAQRFLPGRVGMASGFILGMGFVTGGIGVPITGALADRYGIPEALMATSVLMLVAAGLASRIPRRIDEPGNLPSPSTAS